MKTPAGTECHFYYEDYNRGRNTQVCRLIEVERGASLPWKPSDCKGCPVPEILMANSSPQLELHLQIKPMLLGLGRRKQLTARCSKHGIALDDPKVGCPQCNAEKPGVDLFLQALEKRS